MGKALGALVFAAGVAGLGYWGARSQAVTMEAKIAEAASSVVADAMHPMEVSVSGRDIALAGTADTQGELDRLVAVLDAIRGRRVVHVGAVTVLPEIAPYETALAKGADGSLALTGYAPSAALAAEVPGAEALPLGQGAPEGWAQAIAAGTAALIPLDEGSFALTGTTLTLSGLAATPAEDSAARAALGDLPAFDEVVAIDVTDPGIVDFTLGYDATGGLSASGILPASLGAEGLASALGGLGVAGELETTFAEAPGLAGVLGGLFGELGLLEAATLTATNDRVSLEAQALPGLDAETIRARLAVALGIDVAMVPAPAPQDGAERINAATSTRQVAYGGNWLKMPDFEPTRAACTEAAMATVEAQPILFVTGSAELDPVSLATVNDVAGIVNFCTRDAGMRVFVGGHTDAQGDDTANYSLSLARARAVRDALIQRGVATEKITAVGYGETEPVADNETEEGRAKNRRTTFAWPE